MAKGREKSREFVVKQEDGSEVKLIVSLPNGDTIEKGSLLYKSAFAEAVRSGCMIRAEAERLVKERDLWNEIDEGEVREFVIELQKNEDKLKDDNIDNEEKTLAAAKMSEIRAELLKKTSERNTVYNDLAEGFADEKRTEFYIVHCVTYAESGERVFEDIEDLHNRINDIIAQDAYLQMSLLLIGLSPNYFTEFPETAFLAKEGLIEFSNRDEDGNLNEELEAETEEPEETSEEEEAG